MFQLKPDVGASLASFAKAAKVVEAREKKAATKRAEKTGSGGKGGSRKRVPMTDSPLTKEHAYRVKDVTAKTVHICIGVGQTEMVVKALELQGHTLFQFTQTRNGSKMRKPMPYQCIMDKTGKKAGYTYSWRPTEKWEHIVVHSNDQSHQLFTQTTWPYHPGGLHFRVGEVATEEDKSVDDTHVLNLGRDTEDELRYLKSVKERGGVVVQSSVDVEEWFRGMCSWLEVVPTKDTLTEVREYLRVNMIEWPPTPAQAAELLKGGTLRLSEDMAPNDSWITETRTEALPGDYDPHIRVEMHRKPEPEVKQLHRMWVYREGGEKKQVAAGSREHCLSFIKFGEYSNVLRSQGWTHFQLTFDGTKPKKGLQPLPDAPDPKTVKAYWEYLQPAYLGLIPQEEHRCAGYAPWIN